MRIKLAKTWKVETKACVLGEAELKALTTKQRQAAMDFECHFDIVAETLGQAALIAEAYLKDIPGFPIESIKVWGQSVMAVGESSVRKGKKGSK